jgi:hypothetical protein
MCRMKAKEKARRGGDNPREQDKKRERVEGRGSKKRGVSKIGDQWLGKSMSKEHGQETVGHLFLISLVLTKYGCGWKLVRIIY